MVELLNKMNLELIALVESTSNSRDKLIEEKEKRITKLVDLLERSVSNNEICIVEKDKTIAEKNRITAEKNIIIAEKGNKIVELQILLQIKVLEEPLVTLSQGKRDPRVYATKKYKDKEVR